MRMGIIGPADGAHEELRQAIALFLPDPQLKQIIYLGEDGAIERMVAEYEREQLDEDTFLRRGVQLACSGSADQIEQLLEEDRKAQRLTLLRRLPDAPACAIEMLEKWIILAVHDKAVLEEDDVANAHVILYGRAPEADYKRIGPFSFLTPGPLAQGRVGSIALRDDGGLDLALLDLRGVPVLHEAISPVQAKVVVTS